MSEIEKIQTCVIGAGVVGLAVARELARQGRQVLVLEQDARFGEGVSSRNSEVIHAGIYYPAGSLKATLCVRGKNLLYEYCRERNVSHRRLGKLIVATEPAEEAALESILDRASANGVNDLEVLTAAQVRQLEAEVSATAALLSPSTGIISAAELMTALLGDIEAAGGSLACRAALRSVEHYADGFRLNVDIEGEDYPLVCEELINCAGLGAQTVARSIEGLAQENIPELYFCKGNYFLMQGRSPFNHLIYPVPEQGGTGLGVHATIDLGGQVKFGPDVEYVEQEDYSVSTARLTAGITSIRRYFPSLDPSLLTPGYAGIRPKLQAPGAAPRDFEIQGSECHGIAGLVNLFGIESPGLTSSMAIAETVAARLASDR